MGRVQENRGPLVGFRVLDATQMISGPMATMVLADQGSDVIKVEPPGRGDLTRALGGGKRGMAPIFATTNRNKRSIALDLKKPAGLAVFDRLVARADLFVENFRPGRAERLGIGPARLCALNPRLVYVSISGFGETGPYAERRVYDPVIQALSGLASIQADRPSGRPRMIRLIVPDKVTALTAAQAMTAALLARERSGRGQHVRLSMLDAVVSFLWPEAMARHTFIGDDVGVVRPPDVRDLVFETRDGFVTIGTVSDAEWEGLARALGHEEWLEDERFRTPAGRVKYADARLELTAEAVRDYPRADLLRLLADAEVPSAPILTRDELLEDPQIAANELIVEDEHPSAGRMRQPRPAARFAETPSSLRTGAPTLGQHSDEVLDEAGVGADEIRRLRENRILG